MEILIDKTEDKKEQQIIEELATVTCEEIYGVYWRNYETK